MIFKAVYSNREGYAIKEVTLDARDLGEAMERLYITEPPDENAVAVELAPIEIPRAA